MGAGALGRGTGRVALYFREDAATLGPPPGPRGAGGASDLFDAPAHGALRERLGAGACFFTDLLGELHDFPPAEIQAALWDLVWSGEVTNDAWAPLRTPRLSLAKAGAGARAGALTAARRRGRFGPSRRPGAQAHVQGRWSLTASLYGSAATSGRTFIEDGVRQGDASAHSRRALAELLLERYGIVTRETVLAENIPGGFSALYQELSALETVGTVRRGYFVEGLGGAQFALPGAVERLRAGGGSEDELASTPAVLLAATDPAQPYGAALPWPRREGADAASVDAGTARRGRPARAAGAHVVLVGAEPVLYVERGGRALSVLVDGDDPRVDHALAALAAAVRAGHGPRRLSLERVDGEPVLGSVLEPRLVESASAPGRAS